MEIKGIIKKTKYDKPENFDISFFKSPNETMLIVRRNPKTKLISLYTVDIKVIFDGHGYYYHAKKLDCSYIYNGIYEIGFDLISKACIEVITKGLKIKTLEHSVLEVKNNSCCFIDLVQDSRITVIGNGKFSFSCAERTNFQRIKSSNSFGFQVI